MREFLRTKFDVDGLAGPRCRERERDLERLGVCRPWATPSLSARFVLFRERDRILLPFALAGPALYVFFCVCVEIIEIRRMLEIFDGGVYAFDF